MANAKDTQPGPTETPLMDETTVPSAKPNAETKKDLLNAWAASPAELGNQIAPTSWLVDESEAPYPSGCLLKEKQCVSALTATMEILNLEAPSVAVGCQGLTVEELAEEDLVEGHP